MLPLSFILCGSEQMARAVLVTWQVLNSQQMASAAKLAQQYGPGIAAQAMQAVSSLAGIKTITDLQCAIILQIMRLSSSAIQLRDLVFWPLVPVLHTSPSQEHMCIKGTMGDKVLVCLQAQAEAKRLAAAQSQAR